MSANIQPISPDAGLFGWGTQNVKWGFEGSSQTFLAGGLLVNSSGKLVQATTTASASYTGLVGVALSPATGTAGTISALPIGPAAGIVAYTTLAPDVASFSITVDGTLSGSNAPGTGSLAATGLYGQYSIQQDAASKNWYLVETNTTYPAATVVDFISAPATVNGRVRIQFLHSVSLID